MKCVCTEVFKNKNKLTGHLSCLERVKWWRCTSDNRRWIGKVYSTRKTKWLDGIKQWTKLDTYETTKDWLKIYVGGELVLRHINLLFQKTTVHDYENDDVFLTIREYWMRYSCSAVNLSVNWEQSLFSSKSTHDPVTGHAHADILSLRSCQRGLIRSIAMNKLVWRSRDQLAFEFKQLQCRT